MQLAAHEIVGHEPGPHLLILGGIHGDEFEPMLAARRLPGVIDARDLRGRITMIPCVNEPAFARGTRTGEDGLDLARSCPGRADGSPTERIAHSVSTLIRGADYLIDMHTAGARNQILALAGYTLHPDATVLDVQRRMARAFNLPLVWGTNPRFNGTTLAVARDAGKPAIYVENGGGATYDPARVEQNVQGCRQVCGMLGMLDVTQSASQVQYVVEDDRDHSGHLQRQHPAPATGFFERSVELGDIVEVGRVVGRIVDSLGDRSTPVVAAASGRVLFLRTFPSVHAGEGLLYIFPLTEPGELRFARQADGSA